VTYEVEVASRRRSVRVLHGDGAYDVAVDGRRQTVNAVPIGRTGWSLLLGGRSYDVGIVERATRELTVYVNGQPVPVGLGSKLRERSGGELESGGHTPGSGLGGPQAVAAPMPGRVVKVLVRAGDAVAARQGLIVVEAMKMENELRAPRAGVIREVRVAEGASVEANAVLVVLD
jgi:biotin carboxyl carrier protein